MAKQLNMEQGLYVVEVNAFSQAEKAGLKAGDIILKVDDYEVTDLNTEAVVSRVRGEEGVPVTLTIMREGVEDPFEVEIVRAEIKTESVKGEM